MHILVMLTLVICGYAIGQNFTYLVGLPMIGIGLYVGFGNWGGKSGARQRERAEGMFFLLGLVGIIILILDEIL